VSLLAAIASLVVLLIYGCSDLKTIVNNVLQNEKGGEAMNKTLEAEFDQICELGRPSKCYQDQAFS
jgi:hypothetical protein